MAQPNKLMLHGDKGVFLEDHPYLFRCRSGEDCFLDIQKEMAMLNDFCVVIGDATEHHVHALHVSGYEDPADEWDAEFARAMTGYSANQVGKLFSPASSMVLLYLFLIKSLRSLNIIYNSKNFRKWRSDSRSPEIVQLIELLEKSLGISFGILEDEQMKKVIFQTVRKIRNNFTHGDWVKVEKDLQKVSQVMAFSLVSKLLSKIEETFNEHGVNSDGETPPIIIA
jgi:hypothetical protein